MNNSKLIGHGLLHALGVEAYVLIVALIMSNGEKLFGQLDSIFIGPAIVLMLLVVSVAIVGSLIFVRPALMVYGNQKQEGIRLLLYTLVWLVLIVIINFIVLAFVK